MIVRRKNNVTCKIIYKPKGEMMINFMLIRELMLETSQNVYAI
jgi:hypothetical protein